MWLSISWAYLKSEEQPMFKKLSFGSFDDGLSVSPMKGFGGIQKMELQMILRAA